RALRALHVHAHAIGASVDLGAPQLHALPHSVVDASLLTHLADLLRDGPERSVGVHRGTGEGHALLSHASPTTDSCAEPGRDHSAARVSQIFTITRNCGVVRFALLEPMSRARRFDPTMGASRTPRAPPPQGSP